jgi:hypothetical protein
MHAACSGFALFRWAAVAVVRNAGRNSVASHHSSPTYTSRDGYIGVGFAAGDVHLDRLPGWEPHSYGYHGDDGNAFSGRGVGWPYALGFTTGMLLMHAFHMHALV